jgi:hypothetical protein
MKNDKLFQKIYAKAYQAGMEAGSNFSPTPMVVGHETSPLSGKLDTSRSVEVVNDGVCGFAWVNIKPANSAFANFLRRKGYGRNDSYYGGLTVWIHEFGQSYQRKVKFAGAFAEVIRNEIPTLKGVYVGERLD